jgi:RimJ/RimL family protein N-acetyltransferase
MATPIQINTPRLLLRQWRDGDREPFARLNADPEVMRYFPGVQDRALSDSSIDLWRAHITDHGWGNWAVETLDAGHFIGFVGLTVPRRALPFMPCVELGYRLAREHWRRGYASEAARGALHFGFAQLGLEEIVAYTALVNTPSRAVMESLAMRNGDEDFDHPALPEGHVLRRHCLYRLARAHFTAPAWAPVLATGR